MKNRTTRGNCRKNVIFNFGTASISHTRQFGPGAEKSWFLMQKSSGSLEITKTKHHFSHLLCVEVQNRVQNRDFSENPRWGPYKNHKNVTKNRKTRSNCQRNRIQSDALSLFCMTNSEYNKRTYNLLTRCWICLARSICCTITRQSLRLTPPRGGASLVLL